MFRTVDLMNGTALSTRIAYAPEGFGGGGGDDEPDFDDISSTDLDEDEDADPDIDSETGETITRDKPFSVADLMKAGDEEDTDEDDDSEAAAAEEAAMAEELKASLAGLTLPEDLIPEDFDASDPKQLRKLLQDVQINTATQSLRLMFKPVQATLVRMSNQFRRELKDGVRSGVDGNNAEAQLLAAIPALGDPDIAPFVRVTFAKAQKAHPGNTKAAISATKKALTMVGINLAGRGGSRESGGTGIKSGASALDGFGLTLPPVRRNANRMRSTK